MTLMNTTPDTATAAEAGSSGTQPSVVGDAPRRRRHRRGTRTPADAAGRILMSWPAAVIFGAFAIAPMAIGIYLSLTDWDGVNPARLIGGDNYRRALGPGDFRSSLTITLLIAVIGVIVQNAAGLALALALNRTGRFAKLGRALFFYPVVLPAIAIGYLWHTLLDYHGALNVVLTHLGFAPLDVFASPTLAVGSIVLVTLWQQVGFVMVLYLAGLQAVPAELRQAAQVDGANKWQTFRHVVLPQLAPSVTINVVLGLAGYLKLYELVIALTNGNPAGRTKTTVMRIFEDAFTNGRPGLAAAEGVVLAVLTAVLSFVVILTRRRSEGAVQ